MGASARDVLDQLRAQQPVTQDTPMLPQPEASPARDMLESLRAQDTTAVRSSLNAALPTNPERAARSQQIAQQTGTPPDVVERNFDQLDQLAKTNEYDRMLQAAPALREHMKSVDFAKVAHDDLENATAVEHAVQATHAPDTFTPLPQNAFDIAMRGLAAGGVRFAQGAVGVDQFLMDTLEALGGIPATLGLLPENPFQGAAEPFRVGAQAVDRLATYTVGDTSQQNFMERNVSSAFQSIAQNLPALSLGPEEAPALITMGLNTFGQSFAEARAAGKDPNSSFLYAANQGLTEIATEFPAVTTLFGDIAHNSGLWKTLAHQALTEVPGEEAATIIQDYLHWSELEPNAPFSSYLAARPAAAADTLVSTLIATGVQTGVIHTANRVGAPTPEKQVAQSALEAERLAHLTQLAADSKLRERAPEQFQQFVQNAAAGSDFTDVYVAARELGMVLEQAGIDPKSVSPAVAEQYAAAAATGGDVRIPVGEYAASIAGQDYAQALLPHLRASADSMSQAEAEVFQQSAKENLQAEAQKVLEKQADNAEFVKSVTVVEKTILDNLTTANRFTPDVNKAYAALARDFYVTTANKLGVTPAEAYARYPLRIISDQLADAQMDQGDVADLERARALKNTIVEEGGEHITLEGDTVNATNNVTQFGPRAKAYAAKNAPTSPAKGTTRFNHFGNKADVTALDPNFMGTGMKGAERSRGPTPTLSLYPATGYQKESGVGQHHFVVDVPSDRLYDANKDSLGLAQQATESSGHTLDENGKMVPADTRFDMNTFEQLVKDAGYAGYTTPQAEGNMKGQARVFEKVSVSQPTFFQRPDGNPKIWQLAAQYVAATKNISGLPPQTRRVTVNVERATRIAQAYEAAKHEPENPDVQKAYAALIAETLAQYQAVKQLGLKIEFIKPDQENPYPDGPKQVHEDVLNGHLWVYPTESGFGTETAGTDHPLLMPTNEVIDGHKLLANDVFRIVHDVFGHAKDGNGFGPNGEENAWQSHVRMYSPLAGRAMTSETRGQNSWVNYGPHGEANRADPTKTVYAEQKATLLPEWVSTEGLKEGEQGALQQSNEPTGPRGQIAFDQNGGATIALLKNADLSTFLHETGHFFLETYANIVAHEDAPQSIRDDFNTTLKWFGVDSIEAWNAMSLEQRRPYHEQFARGFEAYLFEGNAPTPELNSMFSRFRAWLLNVYHSLTNLNVELSPEVRRVYARMLASEESIDAAEKARAMAPLFGTAADANMTADEFQQYVDTMDAAHEDAVNYLEKRSLRDMRWASNARSRALKALQADVAEKRDALRAEVQADVEAEPIYQAIRFLKSGEIVTEAGETLKNDDHKLDVTTLQASYPATIVEKLRELQVAKVGGVAPDQLAEMFGFTSGDHLIKEVLAAPTLADAVEAKTDQTMLERYGDITDKASLERAADEAVHNEARGKFVATEIRALNRMLNVRATTEKGGSVNLTTKVAKESAEHLIARGKVKDVKPGQYTAAEARAAKAATEALASNDIQEAATQKRHQLFNIAATRTVYETQAEIKKGLEYLRKFNNENSRKSIDPDYRDQIDSLLERFDLRNRPSERELARRASLLEWVKSQEEQGFSPIIDDALLAEARSVPYSEMTVEQFRGLVDAVRNIEHLGKLKTKLLTAQRDREFADAVTSAAASIAENAKTTVPEELENNAFGQHLKAGVKEFFAMHRKFASILQQMDGFKDGGRLWELLVRPLNAAGDKEAVMRADSAKALHALFKPVLKLGSMRTKLAIPAIGKSLSREGRLSIALNWGNETNRRRVMEGDNWTPAQVNAILSTLTKTEWDFVQGVWDHVNAFWPEIAAKEKRVTGVGPEKVDATPVQTPHGLYRGGYYPIKYDANRSSKAAADSDAEILRQVMQGMYTRATTRRGHTKQRAETVKRPVRKDLGVLFEHITQVVHDLSFHEYLIDANRLVRAKPIDSSVREHYGPEYLRQMQRTLTDVALGELPALNAAEKGLQYLRTGATVAGLGWNVTTALLQPIGLTQSMVRIGPKWVGRGLGRWIGSASHMENSTAWVREKSAFMRLRAQTQQREIHEIQGSIHGKGGYVQQSFFYLIQQMQVVADMPTWLGQYEKSMEQFNGDESKAIALADQAVLDAQGGGQIKDLASIQRGGQLMKLFTNFYSFFNTTHNLAAESTQKTNFKKPGDIGKLAVDFLLLYTVPATLGALLGMALKGGGDDPDGDELTKSLIEQNLSYMLSTMVFIRELGSVVQGYDYRGPAGLRFFTEAAKLYQQAEQGDLDAALLRALNVVGGILFHYPAAQVQRTAEGVAAIANGDTDNPLSALGGVKPVTR